MGAILTSPVPIRAVAPCAVRGERRAVAVGNWDNLELEASRAGLGEGALDAGENIGGGGALDGGLPVPQLTFSGGKSGGGVWWRGWRQSCYRRCV